MRKIFRNLLLISGAFILLASCSSKLGKGRAYSDRYDERTGIDFSNPDFGGLPSSSESSFQEVPEGMVLIQGGRFTMGLTQQNVMGDYDNKPKTIHVPSFYMDDAEVTNKAYTIYLDWLAKVFPKTDPKYKHIYNAAVPDTTVWINPLGNFGSLYKTYLRHSSYQEYPVVGISWVQANDYCKWRTNRVAEKELVFQGILKPFSEIDSIDYVGENHFDVEVFEANPKLLFGGNLGIYTDYVTGIGEYAEIEEGEEPKEYYTEFDTIKPAAAPKETKISDKGVIKLNLERYSPTPNFRLPSEAEWEYAARADIENREFNTIRGRKKYAWSGNNTRDYYSDYNTAFENFKQSRGDYNGIPGWSTDYGDITTPVRIFYPNAFGLFDMGGNVAEWVYDIYRPSIETDESDFAYTRGNIFQKNKINPDGTVSVATFNDIIYDTLPNGKIIPKNIPGQIIKMPIEAKDTYLKPNFSVANNLNYKDGDKASSKDYNKEDPSKIKRMYNSPIIPKPEYDEEKGTYIFKYDDKSRTTLITDYSRVYKGGSWKDREFWLDPGQRRFLEEYMSTNYIGFRCAVDKLGSEDDIYSKREPFF